MNIGSTTGSAFTTGSQGMIQGSEQMAKAAHKVVSATTERPAASVSEVSKGMVAQHEAEIQVQASAKVVQAGSNQLSSIIDIQV